MFPYMLEDKEVTSKAAYYDLDSVKVSVVKRSPQEIAKLADVEYIPEKSLFQFKSLGQLITVSWPECHITFTNTNEKPNLIWRLAILHYLAMADGISLSENLVAFANLSKHVAHPQIFERSTGGELAKKLGDKPIENLKKVCIALGGELKPSNADLNVMFHFLPKYPITMQLWLADDEMEASGKLLFVANGTHYLPVEDIHFIGPMIVDFCINQYELMFF